MKNTTLLFVLLLGISGLQAQIYVDINASGTNDGTSWNDAYTNLQDAINEATNSPGVEDDIFISEGVYVPTETTNRFFSFDLPSDVNVYGGFSPSNGAIDLDTHDYRTYETILSGDIGVEGDASDNSNRVVKSIASFNILIDGVTIREANGVGGIELYESYYTIKNCRILNNTSTEFGGGINILGEAKSVITCLNSVFRGNTGVKGGALHLDLGPALQNYQTFEGCVFQDNTATEHGGAIYLRKIDSDFFAETFLDLTNCTFTENAAPIADFVYFDALTDESLTQLYLRLSNTIVWNNEDEGTDEIVFVGSFVNEYYANTLLQGFDNSGNGGLDGNDAASNPLFLDPANNDLHVESNSPVIDEGDDFFIQFISEDLDGLNRIIDGDTNGTERVDFGAYEYDPGLGLNDYQQNEFVMYPNPSSNVLNIESRVSQTLQSISIYNVLGQEVKFIEFKNLNTKKQISVADIQTGMYLIEIRTSESATTQQFIKN
ncbi:MAG: T9SS type A sorting domain-containing protein [Flavobacteriaceae bacterium]|nr:T9SS type A sorting domain-containing protein [Flavobacteriaceae bacterium]